MPRRYYSRSSFQPRSYRRLQKRNRKVLIFTLIALALFAYFFIFWGIPLLIGGVSKLTNNKSTIVGGTIDSTTLPPPVFNIPYEATKTATVVLQGYSQKNDQVEIYLNNSQVDAVNTLDDGRFSTGLISLIEGENYVFGKTVHKDDITKTTAKSLSSKPIRIIYSNEKPKLDIESPGENTEVKGGDKKITVKGTTDPNNNITINGSITIVNGDGKFAHDLPINDGENQITIIATNNVGNSTEVTRKVTYSNP